MKHQKFSTLVYTLNPVYFHHPPEDAFKASKKYPIYAVADGVTLEVKKGEKYPLLPDRKISGPKMTAEIFCQEAVEFLEKKYFQFQEKSFDKLRVYLKQAFQKANQAIFDFNKRYESDFSTVAALAIIYDGNLFGARITDCGLAVIDKKGVKFKTPEFWQTRGRPGKMIGYGVLNGQKKALEFIDFYQTPLKENDVIIIYSDGFEPYFFLKEFINLFSSWQNTKEVKEKLKDFSERMASFDRKLYGLERTLIAVKCA